MTTDQGEAAGGAAAGIGEYTISLFARGASVRQTIASVDGLVACRACRTLHVDS